MARRRAIWCLVSMLHLLAAPRLLAQNTGQPDTLLHRLTQEALSHAPALRAGELAAAAASRRINAAGARPDPMLTVGVMNLTLPRFAFRESDFTEVDVELSQELPWPGTLRAKTRAAAAEARERRATADATRRDLAARVAALYYRLRYVASARLTLAKQRGLAAAGAGVALARYGAGRNPQADPLQTRVAQARLEAQALAFDTEDAELRAELAALRGQRQGEALSIQPLVVTPDSPAFHRVGMAPAESQAIESHPRVAAMEAAVVAREQDARGERLQARPDFAVMARYGARPLGADFASVAVGVRLPIWAGRKQLASARAAELDVEAARATLAQERAGLAAELQTVKAKVRAGENRLKLLVSRIVPGARATVESSLRGYRVGTVTFASLLAAQDALYAAELEVAAVAAEHLTHLVMLEQLVSPEVAP
jgi:cobalt-zinc-cadmium efflux system outer membrane protein